MTSIWVQLHISMLLLHVFVKGQVPTTGCDAISSGGTCYSYFSTAAGIDWADSRLQCVSQGYDLATITSSEDNTLVYNIATSGLYCWIGLNDINTEETFVWVDGSNNPYRNWDVNQPDNFLSDQDCTIMWGQGYWDDDSCTVKRECYFCGSNVNVFGEVTESTYSSLEDNKVLISDATLYCVTENKNIPQVRWSYVDLAGIRTDLASTTDASTGVSTIQVYTTQPGYYSCEVTEGGGSFRMHAVGILDPSSYTAAVNNHNYSYTTGIDREDNYLWYESIDDSVQLTDIKWRRKGITGTFTNPLLVYNSIHHLQSTSFITIECVDTTSSYFFTTVGIFFQGPPIILMRHGSVNSFYLLPPDINRADVEVLTQNVVLSTNLVGRWLTPSNSYVTTDTLNFPLLHQTDEGLYEFYITNWDGLQELAIQIYLSISESTQRITNLRAETLNQTSLLVTWELLETNQIFQNMTFSIHHGFGIYEGLAGTTTEFYYVLSNLSPNANYSIRVESVIPYSTQEISSTIYHFLEFDKVTPLQISNQLSDYLPFILIGGILIIVILFVLVVTIVVTCCIMKRRAVKHSTTPNPDTNPKIFEQPAHANEIYELVPGDAINEQIVKPPTYANTKIFEQPAHANEAYELVPGDAIYEQIVKPPTYATILEKREENIGQHLPIYRSPN